MSTSNELLLSDILKSTPKFSFFQELINVRQLEKTNSETLLKYDFFKINKTINDIIIYLEEILDIFYEISNSNLSQGLNWIHEGKVEILEILKNIESIDSIISQLLIIIEIKTNENEITSINYMKLLNDFEQISELSLNVKKFVLTYKKRLDVSIQFNELDAQVIDSINNEIDSCLKSSFKIYEIKLSTPSRVLPNFNLDQILTKMKVNETTKISLRSIKLPTFNSLDEMLYQNYLDLEARVSPLDASINFIPLRLEEYKHIAKDYYPDSVQVITDKFNNLLEKWKYLNKELKQIKSESLDQRWNEIFEYLINEVNTGINDLSKDLENDNGILSHQNTPKYKLSRSVLNVIEKGFQEKLINDSNLRDLFEELTIKWNNLNSTIKVNESIDSQNNENSISKIKTNSNESLNDYNHSANNSYDNSQIKRQSPIEFGLKKLHISPSPESAESRRDSFDIQLFPQLNRQNSNNLETPTKLSKKQMTGRNFLRRLSIQPILVGTTPVSIEKSRNSSGFSDLINPPTINQQQKNVNDKLYDEFNKSDSKQESDDEFNFSNHPVNDNSTPINRVNRLSDSIIHEDEMLTDFTDNVTNELSAKVKNLTISIPHSNGSTSPQSKRSSTNSNYSSSKSSPKVARSKLPVLLSPMTPKHISKFNIPSRRASMIPVLSTNYSKLLQSPNYRRSSVGTGVDDRAGSNSSSTSQSITPPTRQLMNNNYINMPSKYNNDGYNKRQSMLVQPTSTITKVESRTRPHSALNGMNLYGEDSNTNSRSNSRSDSRYDHISLVQPKSPRPTWR